MTLLYYHFLYHFPITQLIVHIICLIFLSLPTLVSIDISNYIHSYKMCMFILEEKKLGKKVKSTPKLTYFQLNGKQKNRNLYFPAQNYDQFLHDLRYGVT